jgi:preprotein translocase subunit SecA
MRLFGSDRIAGVMERLGLKEGELIQHPMITRSVQRAQKKVEENNFAIRKRLLEYDNVMNQQREVVYTRRRHALVGERLREDLFEMLEAFVEKQTEKFYAEGEIEPLRESIRTNLLVDFAITGEQWLTAGKDGVAAEIMRAATDFYKRKEERIGSEQMAMLEKMVCLQVMDDKWKDHLREMDDLKEGIHLRAYGQKDPIVEYKTEAFNMFVELLEMISTETLNMVFKLFPTPAAEIPVVRAPRPSRPQQMTLTHAASAGMGFQGVPDVALGDEDADERQSSPPEARAGKPQPIQVGDKVGRNDPCPCGSGKKYKQCHGA